MGMCHNLKQSFSTQSMSMMSPVSDPGSVRSNGGKQRVSVLHPELKSTYQRGIYLYAKSLMSGLKSGGFETLLLTDFLLNGPPAQRLQALCDLVAKPPRERVRAIQALPRLLRHRFGFVPTQDLWKMSSACALSEENRYLAEVDLLLNYERFYDMCRLVVSKRSMDPVNIDFLEHFGSSVAIAVEPLAVRSGHRKVKVIQTVHDLIILNSDAHDLNVGKFKRRLEASFAHADMVVAVSQYTAQEIADRYPSVAPRTRVLYQPIPANDRMIAESASSQVRAEVLERRGLRAGGFIFFVGAIEERKNVARLIEAYSQSSIARDVPLVMAGALAEDYLRSEGLLYHFQADRGVQARGGGVQYLGRITELEKLCLLREAMFFAFPTLTEGFGIPVLEAQSMGCPVLTTNGSAIPEVVGCSAALINDPTDVDEILAGVESLASDASLRQRLSAEGLLNSQRFSKANFSANLRGLIQEVN